MKDLQERLRAFAAERDWTQFHTPKNLAMAVAGEAGELVAEFQWLTDEESWAAGRPGQLREQVSSEIADVAIYLALLASALDLDLSAIMLRKIERNETRFPANSSQPPTEPR